jgi:hypothetical protein
MIKKFTPTLICLMTLTAVLAQKRDTLTVGKNEFAISSNTYSFFQTIESSSWNRSVYIYPRQAMIKTPIAGLTPRIQAFQLYKDVSRVATAAKVPGKMNPKANYKAKIYMANTALADWSTIFSWDSVLLVTKPTLVFDGDIKSFIDSTNGWKTFTLQKPFLYEPDKNLAIAVEYVQDSGVINQVYWSYDTTHVRVGDKDTVNYFSRFQFKFCHKPFSRTETPVNSFTGSNIRHPHIRFIYDLLTDVNDLSYIEKSFVFPNPASEILHCNISSKENKQLQWSISDMQGRIITQNYQEILRGEQTLSIPINHLANGYFLLVLFDGKGILTRQFVKQ